MKETTKNTTTIPNKTLDCTIDIPVQPIDLIVHDFLPLDPTLSSLQKQLLWLLWLLRIKIIVVAVIADVSY